MAAVVGLRVLLAERLPLVGALLRDILCAAPEVVIIAQVGVAPELLPCARALQPDLVLLDWSLGGLTTLQALIALRPAPVVMVTLSGAMREYRPAVLAHGATACLTRERLRLEAPAALQQLIKERKNEPVH